MVGDEWRIFETEKKKKKKKKKKKLYRIDWKAKKSRDGR